MEPTLAILVGVLVLVPVLGIRLALHHRTLKVWRAAADRLGMQLLSMSTGLSHPLIGGYIGDLWVQVEEILGKRGGFARITVSGRALPVQLALRPETLGTGIAKLVEGEDIATGDATFDSAVLIHGDPDEAALVLGKSARARVGQALRAGVRVEAGRIVLESRDRLLDPETAVRVISDLVSLAGELRLPRDVPGRLCEWARRDPCPGARLRFLSLLTRRHAADPRTPQTVERALEDPSPEVRLAAAVACGEAGRATLHGLLADPGTPEGTACRAAAALGGGVDATPAIGALDSAIADRKDELARALIDALAATADPTAIRRLVEVLREPRLELAEAAAGALGMCPAPDVEEALVAALSSERSRLRETAAASLGRVGTVSAVASLHAAVAAHPLDLGLRNAVTTAVGSIQARVPGASAGQLSLAPPTGGAVSLAEASTHGELTLRAEHEESPTPRRSEAERE